MFNSSLQLKKLRQYLKITQDEFAEKIGVKRNSISMIESGRNKPTFDMIVDICQAFNISADYFLSTEEPNSKNIKAVNNNVQIVNISDIELGEADFLNAAQEKVKRVNYLYQSLINVRLLLFQELKIKGDLATKAEADLLNTLARPSVIENEFIYPYADLDKNEKADYLRKIDSCITLFTNTFFECFEQFYNGVRLPADNEIREAFLKSRERLTDRWHYSHLKDK